MLKELKGTYFDAYLWQTMGNHAKKSMEELKLPDSVFLQGDGRSSVLKTLKTTKTRKTKTPVSQIFQILWPSQGGTMWKGMARAFRKCVTFGGGVVLIHSYMPWFFNPNISQQKWAFPRINFHPFLQMFFIIHLPSMHVCKFCQSRASKDYKCQFC